MNTENPKKLIELNLYKHPLKIPRTIDRLAIGDCIEIIVKDLERYGVPESLAMEIITEYFVPLKAAADEAKNLYGSLCFKNSPDCTFFE